VDAVDEGDTGAHQWQDFRSIHLLAIILSIGYGKNEAGQLVYRG
jgi:hypothetical protein